MVGPHRRDHRELADSRPSRASAHRTHRLGCAAAAPTFSRYLQQRGHFTPGARSTRTVTAGSVPAVATRRSVRRETMQMVSRSSQCAARNA